MGLACPVCSTPQADGEHLANHLAFAALLHGGDHEAWLDANVPDWAERDPGSLASAATPLAEETDDDVPGAGPKDGEHARVTGFDAVHRADRETASLDPETRRIVERAREMTMRMRSAEDPQSSTDSEE